MKTLSDLKQEFMSTIQLSDIHYAWDAGHCYSYLDHPLIGIDFDNNDDQDEWDEFTNDWLYSNDDCPPCQISIVDGVVGSGCGCHDRLDYVKDREEVESIIMQLENHPDNK